MGWFDWLFGGNDEADDASREMVEYVDEKGRERRVPRDEYRDEVLPEQFARTWDDAEALYETVRRALDDGFAEEALEPARRLRELDPNAQRGATMLGLAYWKLDRLDEAESIYRECVEREGESAVLLTNLAKVHAERGDDERARETLWRALEIDPNLTQAVDTWASFAVDDADDLDESYRDAMERVAELPDAWYAHVCLARFYFEQDRDDEALESARAVAEIAPKQPGALMDITGQLGRRDHPEEMLDLFVDLFDPTTHRPRTGINLIRACLETGRTELGENLCGVLADADDPHIQRAVDEAREALASD